MPFGISFLWVVLVTTQVTRQRFKWPLILTSITEEGHKDVFNECPTGPNLDPFYIRLSNAAPFCENYAKLYFDAKHLNKRELNRGW